MWHEARKQERRIRGMIVDYRKRAERRQDFYEKIQADPTQFIQVHGRRCKIHLDPAVAAAGDGAAIIVPWQGQQDNLIDRFDVRAHLDHIPSAVVNKMVETESSEISSDERQCNYERYRILAQNDFLNVSEEKFLHQLYLEEQFGANAQLEAERAQGKKKQQKSGATIGYSYDDTADSSIGPQPFSHLMHVPPLQSTLPAGAKTKSDKDSDSDTDSDMDMDVAIDISKLDTTQAHELNSCGRNYGMVSNDFYSYLTKDADEADALRIAREEEQEKMLLSGRKSRRERRAQKERRIAARPFSPPSYAAKEIAEKKEKDEESESRSPSPADANAGKITYITSFGGEDELQPHSKISINIGKGQQTIGESCMGAIAAAHTSGTSGHVTYAQKVKENLEKLKQLNESTTNRQRRSGSNRSRSRSTSRGRRRGHYRRSYTRSRSRSYDRRRKNRRSHSSSYERSRRQRKHKKSRSRSHSRHHRYRSSNSSGSSRKRTSRSASSSSRHSRHKSRRSPKTKTPPTAIHRSRSASKMQAINVVVPVKLQSEKKVSIVNVAVSKPPEVATAPPMISYPLPARVMSTAVTASLGQSPVTSVATSLASNVTVSTVETTQVVEPPPPPLKRYYGRKRADDDESSSESDTTSDVDKELKSAQTGDANDSDDRMDVDTTSDRSNPLPTSSTTTGKQTGKYSTVQAKNPSFSIASETKTSGSSRLNLRERLKRKMQNLLNKQYKADKRAEIEKTERERQLQQEREDEMRELALKLRRRQRELRHRYGTRSPSSGKNTDDSETAEQLKTKRSKSRTIEPPAKVLTRSRDRHLNRSVSREHTNRSRSRSESHRRTDRVRRSHSRSRNRRSTSRRRRRSPSRSQRQKETSSYSSRYGTERERDRLRCEERYKRSDSRSERSGYRDRDKERERERDRDRDRGRDRERDRGERSSRFDRDRDRIRERWNRDTDRDKERYYQKSTETITSGSSRTLENAGTYLASAEGHPSSSGGSSRNKIVFSAPPKLKKLVDY